MTGPVDALAAILMLLGAGLSVTAAVGLLRLPDVLARIHAQSKPAVLGLILILGGVALHVRDARLTGMTVLAVGLQLATAPVGSHLLGRAVHRHNESAQRASDEAKARRSS